MSLTRNSSVKIMLTERFGAQLHERAKDWCQYFENLEGRLQWFQFQYVPFMYEGSTIVGIMSERVYVLCTIGISVIIFKQWVHDRFRLYLGDEIGATELLVYLG